MRVAIFVGTVVIVSAPLGTYLAPSTKTLRDAYLVLALAVLAVCVVGFGSAYVKRLHDMGLRGYWALVFIVALPAALVQAASAYSNYRYLQDKSSDAYAVFDILFPVVIALPFLIAMWRGDKGANKFGSVPEPIEHVAASKFNLVAMLGAAAILIPTSIYAGLFQSGVWVGRGNSAPSMPDMESNVPGIRFMKCWNVKGVGAGSGEGPGSGVYRDGFTGNLFDFLVTPNGQIDIAMAGERGGNSYIADGFRIIPYGLQLPNDGAKFVNVRGTDHFMLVAVYDQGGSGAEVNYTTFAFARNKGVWPEYHVVMTTTVSSSENAIALAKFPEARGRLMIGDCITS